MMTLIANLKAYLILVVLMLCLTVGSSAVWYHKGYSKAEHEGQTQLIQLQADLATKSAIETARQLAVNMEAKAREAQRLRDLADRMGELEAELLEQHGEELQDPLRNNEAFSKESAVRIGKVK